MEMSMINAIVLFVLFFSAVQATNQTAEIAELLADGGYWVNPTDKSFDGIKRELDLLPPAIAAAVHQKAAGRTAAPNAQLETQQFVFNVGIVVEQKPHKILRKIDFIDWAHNSFNMRGLALGKKYIGVSFNTADEQKGRLFVYFVEPKRLEKAGITVESADQRTPLNSKISELFAQLKAVTEDDE
ncbi:hypothetical protein M3Y99_00570500 [Aphelenchoides fujianensis]|nr:hypothetical protein M3Y99_00570500 [Aphelenchoides fujianensis]